MTDYQFIDYSVANRVATIALNTPDKLNAFHKTMRMELIDAVQQVERDDGVRIAILTGRGRSFSAGADLTEGKDDYPSFVEQCAAEYTPWLMGIHNSSKLYIAAVNGACAGIGTAAAMNCDLMVMADDAYIYQAFAAIGLMPDGGANWLLVHKLGYSRALQLAVEAGSLTANECLSYGIANKVVPAAELEQQARDWAETLAQGSPLSQSATKNLMRRVPSLSYEETIKEESAMQNKMINSEDSVNAIESFFNKQKAVFKGR